jgi:hypothetical protein
VLATQQRGGNQPSVAHDATVLEAARAVGAEIRGRPHRRSRRPAWPLSLAAALILGIAIGRGSWFLAMPSAPQAPLTVPSHSPVRGAGGDGAAGSTIPVEQADPAVWYRYIQELVFSGQIELAEAHLRRFRELHPDFVYQP